MVRVPRTVHGVRRRPACAAPGWRRAAGRVALCAGAAFLACVPGRSAACESDKLDAVHFNSGHPDFGSVPRRGLMWYEHTDRPVELSYAPGDNDRATYVFTEERDEARLVQRDKVRTALFHQASVREGKGDWAGACRAYERLAHRLGWTGDIRDRVEVLGRVARLGRSSRSLLPPLRRYLHAMAEAESGKVEAARVAFAALSVDAAAGFLREHAVYQQACLAHKAGRYGEAIGLYQRALAAFPGGAKREACLLMIARCSILPASTAAETAVGMAALRTLLATSPRTRFRAKATGLAGRAHLLEGRLHEAAWCYLRVGDLESVQTVLKAMPRAESGRVRVALFFGLLGRLDGARSAYQYQQAIYGIDRLVRTLTTTDAFRISLRLTREPRRLPPYLEYRLYHCHNTPAQMAALAHLADRVVRRFPATTLPAAVRTRLAEAFYEHREYGRALAWSALATQAGAREEALFVRGAALGRLGRRREALATFEGLIARYPGSPLVHGAREELAILLEAVGDLKGALAQYFLLGYQADAAFLLDARMSVHDVEAFYRTIAGRGKRVWEMDPQGYAYYAGSRPARRYAERDLVAYSLGIRYLRKEEWNRAALWLRRVSPAVYAAFSRGRTQWESKASPDPLTAIARLRQLQAAVRSARSRGAKAQALYRYATYYYTHGTLLLYNSAAWLEERRYGFDDCWNETHATPADEDAVRAHMYEHDVYARSLALCKEVARRYPDTPTAPRALYRAACAAYYLSNFNEWWRTGHRWRGGERQGERLEAEAVRLMRQLARRYPRDALARPALKYAAVFGSHGAAPQ